MPNPQNPEIRRSEENIRPRVELGPDPQDVGGETGAVPADNQPGHHPQQEQDKPDVDKFAEAMGIKPDTEVDSEEAARAATRSTRRAAKKATARKATSGKATSGAAAGGGGRAAGSATPRTGAKPASETPVTAASTPSAAASTPTLSASAVGAGAPSDEPPRQAAELHHHALPDQQLPHDTGLVTPTGTPVTSKLVTWPLRYWGTVLKSSGDLIAAYGNALRRAGERMMPGGK